MNNILSLFKILAYWKVIIFVLVMIIISSLLGFIYLGIKGIVAGAFFFGPVQALKDYQKAYHQAIQELQRKGIADDDQAVVAYIYYNIFHNITFHIAGFKGAFKLLCDGSIPTN